MPLLALFPTRITNITDSEAGGDAERLLVLLNGDIQAPAPAMPFGKEEMNLRIIDAGTLHQLQLLQPFFDHLQAQTEFAVKEAEHEIAPLLAHEIPIKTQERRRIPFIEEEGFEAFEEDAATERTIAFLPDRRSVQRRAETAQGIAERDKAGQKVRSIFDNLLQGGLGNS